MTAALAVSHSCLYPTTAQGDGMNATLTPSKEDFIDDLVDQMTIADLVMQVCLFFADDAVGPNSDNAQYDQALAAVPGSPIGIIHDWYPLNKTYVNELQRLNLEKSHLKISFMHSGECNHGVGSFQQSMFPQPLAMGASWDQDLVNRVGNSIGAEARSIGIHACFCLFWMSARIRDGFAARKTGARTTV